MGRIAGRYTSKRGFAYSYDITWQQAGEGVIWSATVKRDHELIETFTGQMRAPTGPNAADEIQRLVEMAIEKWERRR